MWVLFTDGSQCPETKYVAGAFVLVEGDCIIEKKSIPAYDKSWLSQEAELFALSLGVFSCVRRKINNVVLVSDYAPAKDMFLKRGHHSATSSSKSKSIKRRLLWEKRIVEMTVKNNITVMPIQRCEVLKYHDMCDKAAKFERVKSTGKWCDLSGEKKAVHIGWSEANGFHAIAAVVLVGRKVVNSNSKIITDCKNHDKIKNLAMRLGRQVADTENVELVLEADRGRKTARDIARYLLWESRA